MAAEDWHAVPGPLAVDRCPPTAVRWLLCGAADRSHRPGHRLNCLAAFVVADAEADETPDMASLPSGTMAVT